MATCTPVYKHVYTKFIKNLKETLSKSWGEQSQEKRLLGVEGRARARAFSLCSGNFRVMYLCLVFIGTQFAVVSLSQSTVLMHVRIF